MPSNTWKVLDLKINRAPKLLIRSRFDLTGYSVEITDFSHVWVETLSRSKICQQATGCGIDPSDDDGQFEIFLGKIESALKRERDTSLALIAQNDDLVLNLIAHLPKPLTPFKWTLHLFRGPENAIKQDLVIPLMVYANQLHKQLQQLVNELHDKDRIISKILDRLETSGNDLSTVFPRVANIKTNRKNSQREQFAKYVKGLADFNEALWIEDNTKSIAEEPLSEGSANGVLEHLETAVVDENDAEEYVRWWEYLSDGSVPLRSASAITPATVNGSSSRSDHQMDNAMPDGGSQEPNALLHLEDGTGRHRDPVILKEPSNRNESGQNRPEDGSTTEEEDDLDAHSEVNKDPAKTTKRVFSPHGWKIGMIGGPSVRGAESRVPGKTTEDTWNVKQIIPPASGATGSRIGIPEEHLADQVTKTPLSSKARLETKLGTIGGNRSKQNTADIAELDSNSHGPPSSPHREVAEQRDEGDVAPFNDSQDKGGLMESPTSRHDRSPLRHDSRALRENSQERADRKRDDLKRELQQKAKSAVKKRRKF